MPLSSKAATDTPQRLRPRPQATTPRARTASVTQLAVMRPAPVVEINGVPLELPIGFRNSRTTPATYFDSQGQQRVYQPVGIEQIPSDEDDLLSARTTDRPHGAAADQEANAANALPSAGVYEAMRQATEEATPSTTAESATRTETVLSSASVVVADIPTQWFELGEGSAVPEPTSVSPHLLSLSNVFDAKAEASSPATGFAAFAATTEHSPETPSPWADTAASTPPPPRLETDAVAVAVAVASIPGSQVESFFIPTDVTQAIARTARHSESDDALSNGLPWGHPIARVSSSGGPAIAHTPLSSPVSTPRGVPEVASPTTMMADGERLPQVDSGPANLPFSPADAPPSYAPSPFDLGRTGLHRSTSALSGNGQVDADATLHDAGQHAAEGVGVNVRNLWDNASGASSDSAALYPAVAFQRDGNHAPSVPESDAGDPPDVFASTTGERLTLAPLTHPHPIPLQDTLFSSRSSSLANSRVDATQPDPAFSPLSSARHPTATHFPAPIHMTQGQGEAEPETRPFILDAPAPERSPSPSPSPSPENSRRAGPLASATSSGNVSFEEVHAVVGTAPYAYAEFPFPARGGFDERNLMAAAAAVPASTALNPSPTLDTESSDNESTSSSRARLLHDILTAVRPAPNPHLSAEYRTTPSSVTDSVEDSRLVAGEANVDALQAFETPTPRSNPLVETHSHHSPVSDRASNVESTSSSANNYPVPLDTTAASSFLAPQRTRRHGAPAVLIGHADANSPTVPETGRALEAAAQFAQPGAEGESSPTASSYGAALFYEHLIAQGSTTYGSPHASRPHTQRTLPSARNRADTPAAQLELAQREAENRAVSQNGLINGGGPRTALPQLTGQKTKDRADSPSPATVYPEVASSSERYALHHGGETPPTGRDLPPDVIAEAGPRPDATQTAAFEISSNAVRLTPPNGGQYYDENRIVEWVSETSSHRSASHTQPTSLDAESRVRLPSTTPTTAPVAHNPEPSTPSNAIEVSIEELSPSHSVSPALAHSFSNAAPAAAATIESSQAASSSRARISQELPQVFPAQAQSPAQAIRTQIQHARVPAVSVVRRQVPPAAARPTTAVRVHPAAHSGLSLASVTRPVRPTPTSRPIVPLPPVPSYRAPLQSQRATQQQQHPHTRPAVPVTLARRVAVGLPVVDTTPKNAAKALSTYTGSTVRLEPRPIRISQNAPLPPRTPVVKRSPQQQAASSAALSQGKSSVNARVLPPPRPSKATLTPGQAPRSRHINAI